MGDREIVLYGKHITKQYNNTTVLTDIDIELFAGDFTVIMGSSGSGKSTLLYCLSGMEQATSGEIRCMDMTVSPGTERVLQKLRAEYFGFVFQKSHLVSNLTLYENILTAGLISGKQDEDRVRKRADELVLQMNLSQAKDRLPAEVSGGEAQRAAVARAVTGGPTILFADEPTGALNRANTREVLDLFTGLNRDGQSIVLVTHDREAALRGNRILYLEDGNVTSEISLEAYDGKNEQREKKLSLWLEEAGW